MAATATEELTSGEVQHQLARIVCSPDFKLPRRSVDFLSYVVNETLEGRSTHLKAFTIALSVFGRDSTFDAQNDPCVRLDAGRIRRALERYYLMSGRNDPVIITIPKGSYVAAFRRSLSGPSEVAGARDQAPRPDASIKGSAAEGADEPASGRPQSTKCWCGRVNGPTALALSALGVATTFFPREADHGAAATSPSDPRPVVVVEHFEIASRGDLASTLSRGLNASIISRLVQFRDVVVAVPIAKVETEGKGSRLVYSLQGSVQLEGGKLRVSAQLVRRTDGTVVLARGYDDVIAAGRLAPIQDLIADTLADAIECQHELLVQPGRSESTGNTKAFEACSEFIARR
ncbi:hypothetical protein DTW90_25825 [Neorhizobium sp. P12A]|uniref:hypothetical protein n=1 Tax=Neorhizobium sp. P12A TaxID=2268027 RepID=UPI0011ED9113|nr:hypothetical protein [Neorhizobium sp. P12A]KAA0693280.1 hypothetical protein DTW90_25825 [Neorhizobium sp. P12A]